MTSRSDRLSAFLGAIPCLWFGGNSLLTGSWIPMVLGMVLLGIGCGFGWVGLRRVRT